MLVCPWLGRGGMIPLEPIRCSAGFTITVVYDSYISWSVCGWVKAWPLNASQSSWGEWGHISSFPLSSSTMSNDLLIGVNIIGKLPGICLSWIHRHIVDSPDAWKTRPAFSFRMSGNIFRQRALQNRVQSCEGSAFAAGMYSHNGSRRPSRNAPPMCEQFDREISLLQYEW